MKVTIDEIVQTLVSCGASQLASAIREHGIAPPEGWVLVPVEPTDKMIYIGGHVNSEWLNDNAPLGESRYQKPIKGIYKAMLSAVKEKE